MSTGPLRRVVGTLGLIGLSPVAFLLATGSLTPEEAAIRALIVVVVVVILGRLARAVLTAMLGRFERRAGEEGDPAPAATGRAPRTEASSPAG